VKRFSEKIMRQTKDSWKGPAMFSSPGPSNLPIAPCLLEQAQHDRADKGESSIRGNHAQSADPRCDRSHGGTPVTLRLAVGVLTRINRDHNGTLARKKDSAAVRAPQTWLKTREINMLKSL
jgi:hypothetical protein